jgi:hypothetical protein
MSDEHKTHEEEPDETERDLEVPDDQAEDVGGGSLKIDTGAASTQPEKW